MTTPQQTTSAGGPNKVRVRCILNHRWADRAPSAWADSRSRGWAPDQCPQPKSNMQNHLVPKRCFTHIILLHGGDSQIVITIWCSSSGDPPVRKSAGVVEYFGTRINRNRFQKILGYFGTIPNYPAPGGRIFGNLQDISEPPSRRFHMIF